MYDDRGKTHNLEIENFCFNSINQSLVNGPLCFYKTYLQNETKSSDADSGGNMNTMPTGVQGAENNK